MWLVTGSRKRELGSRADATERYWAECSSLPGAGFFGCVRRTSEIPSAQDDDVGVRSKAWFRGLGWVGQGR